MNIHKALTCRHCGGLELVDETFGRAGVCPKCGARFYGTLAYSVDWDQVEKAYEVALEFPRPYGSDGSELRLLPIFIAEESFCGCGTRLSVGSHSLQLKDDRLQFKGKFFCATCANGGKTAISKVRSGIAKLWHKIASLKVGPDGLEIQKKGR